MRVIDADKMIKDTLAMKKNIAEAIECDGIVKYLEEHSFDIDTISVKENDTIIVKIKMQAIEATHSFAKCIKQCLEKYFPNNKVIVMLNTPDSIEIKTTNKD